MEKSCGTITIKDNKVLMVRQKLGHISFPKGHVEEGETEIETALRETYEETNVKVVIPDNTKRYTMAYPVRNNVKEVALYIASVEDEKDMKPQENEISEVFWVDINKVRDLLTYDNTKVLWDKVYSDLKKLDD